MATEPTPFTGPQLVADAALFDEATVPLAGDARSVAELLTDADYLARQLTYDATAANAAALVNGWPSVAAAATELWESFPRTTPPGQTEATPAPEVRRGVPRADYVLLEGDVEMQNIARIGRVMKAEAQRPRSFPEATEPAPVTVELAGTLRRARDLVQRYAAQPPETEQGVADLRVVQTRLMHAVYVTAHGVGTAVHERARQAYDETPEVRRADLAATGNPYAIGSFALWSRRLADTEAYAGAYSNGRLGERTQLAAPGGRGEGFAGDAGRLRRALATWDAATERVLSGESVATTDVVTIARTQVTIAGAAGFLIDAGDSEAPGRLLDDLDVTRRRWQDLADRWTDFVPSEQRDASLAAASAELRTAIRELTHEGPTLRDPAAVRTHPGYDQALVGLRESLRAAPEAGRQLARHGETPGRRGPARQFADRIRRELSAQQAELGSRGRVEAPWIEYEDQRLNRVIAVPRPLERGLVLAADRATAAGERTVDALAALPATAPFSARVDAGQPATSTAAVAASELPRTHPLNAPRGAERIRGR